MTNESQSTRSGLARILLSPDEARLRAGWRIAGQISLFIAGLFLFTIPFSFLLFLPESILQALGGERTNNLVLLVGAPAQFLAAIASVYLARRYLDRRSFTSLGLSWNGAGLRDLLVGIALPAAMLGSIFLIQWGLGWLEVQTLAWERLSLPYIAWQTLLLFLVFVAVGFYEELTFRGYWLRNLTEGLNVGWGVFISSFAFAISHYLNPGFSPSALLGLLISGLFFAYSYIRAGNLWLPIGIHIGWNFFEGPVYGYQVSGLEAFRFIEQTVQGPEIWTGGDFGPEAGLLLIPALILGTIFIAIYTQNRQGVTP